VKNIIKEPLLHFLLLGAILYFFYTLNAVETTPNAVQKQQILITKEQIAQLEKEFIDEFGQTPCASVIELLIDQKATKEILLNEAYKLKLYKEDKEIQKLLLQKMHFILNAATEQKEPTQKELLRYYKEHIKDYSKRQSISFYFIHFPHLSQEQRQAFYKLAASLKDFKDFQQLKEQTQQEIKERFGSLFLTKITRLRKKVLSHAIPSKDGLEFVYITDYSITDPYSFEDVEDRVYQDYLQEQKNERYDKMLSNIKKSYDLKIIK